MSDNQELQIYFPPEMGPHVQRVFAGEYDVPYDHASPVILDIGANIGAFALWVLMSRWPRARVICYEPNPEALHYLRQNLALFGSSVQVRGVGVGRENEKRKLFRGLNNLGEASFFDLGAQDIADAIEVDVLGAAELPAANIVKLDAEGAEVEILETMALAGSQPDVILLEYHSEARRRACDELLVDYILVSGHVSQQGRGTFKYLHHRLLGSNRRMP